MHFARIRVSILIRSPLRFIYILTARRDFLSVPLRATVRECKRPYNRIRLADCWRARDSLITHVRNDARQRQTRPRAMTMMMVILPPAKCVTCYATRRSHGRTDDCFFSLDDHEISLEISLHDHDTHVLHEPCCVKRKFRMLIQI